MHRSLRARNDGDNVWELLPFWGRFCRLAGPPSNALHWGRSPCGDLTPAPGLQWVDEYPLPVVRLKNAWRSSHPWIFQKLVEKPTVRPKPGSIVDVVGIDGEFIGRGFYNGHSRIAVRILETDQNVPVDAGWFSRKIAQAVSLRREVLKLDAVSDAWRVVHSEGDGLSGLVVDRYGDLVVVEFFAAGMFRHREWIYDALREQFPGCRFHSFADEHVQKQESFDFHGNTTTEASVITEYGIKFRADPVRCAQDRFLRRPAREP